MDASGAPPAAAELPPGSGGWLLWRIDEHGNRFAMARFDTRERAEAAARDYAARGHKQGYFVEAG